MSDTEYAAYQYSHLVAIIFGILGNIWVISILKKKIVLRKNHYFLVLQLAICDFGSLTIFLFDHSFLYLLKGQIVLFPTKLYILSYYVSYLSSSLGNRHDVDFSASLSCYCASLKTCHQSTQIESCLWPGVHCGFHCGLWTCFTVRFLALERC